LKTNIIGVYANLPNNGKDLHEMAGKQPINILHEIELDINTNIKTIEYIFKVPKWEPLLQKQEGLRQTARFEERKKQRDDQERIEKAYKQGLNEAKQTKVVKKIGKKMMERSNKPTVKHVEKVIDVDKDTAD